MSEAPKLLPCPFCGCTDVSNNDDGDHEWFECDWCHATSGFDPAPEFEELPPSFHWNRRALSASQEAAAPSEEPVASAKYWQCRSLTNPCIVCGKPKFIDREWLKRKIEEDGDEGEIGAGFELFASPAVAPVALPIDRDQLGRFVREAWVRWAQTQPSPKASWLAPYDDLAEADKEADRQIGEAMFLWSKIHLEAAASPAPVAGVGVSVKALSWKLRSDNRYRSGFKFGSYYADIYEISFRDSSYWLDDGQFSFMDQRFESAEAAKAAAQSDFNARILSSIIPATKGGEDTLDILEGIESDLEFLRIAINSGDPHRELRVRVADVTDLVNTLRATLSAQDTDGVAKP